VKKLNERLFDGSAAESEIEDCLSDAGVLFEKIGWDYYDNSLELYEVQPDYRLSDEAKKIIQDAGFSICYVNHTDKWETHYGSGNEWKGWRVSYPHKRDDGDTTIWLEEPVASWPTTFNTTIKPPRPAKKEER